MKVGDYSKLEKIAKKWQEIYEQGQDLHDAVLKEIGTETSLTRIANMQLKEMGYSTSLETFVDLSSRVDILAEKKNERLIVEVKGTDNPFSNQLVRYERDLRGRIYPPSQKIILVLPIWDGKNFEVWGIKQLLDGIREENKELLTKIVDFYRKSAEKFKSFVEK